MTKITTCLLLLIFQQCSSMADTQSCWQSTINNGQQVQSVRITHPEGISVSWDNIRGTSNLTFTYTNDISITSQYSDGTLQVKVASSKISSSCGSKIGFMTSFLIFICCYFATNRFGVSIIILVLCATVVFTLPSDCSKPHIHVEVPFKYTEKICINQEKCIPTKCQLLLSSTNTYSEIPSNNRILFEDKFCKIRKPEFWDEWSLLKLGFNAIAEELYLLDFDGDGLVNLVEYYGNINLFNQSSPTSTSNGNRRKRDVVQVSSIGTDPKNADSDGDLLLDGFEYFNEMSPVKADDSNADYDSDGLSNIREQILNTNPKNPDTDGDGVDDGTEVNKGSNPNDPSDQGEKDESLQDVTIKLTIGDHSGSHSERYLMNVGTVSHQSPGFGLIGTGIYTFSVGTYSITVQHVATKFRKPDYDYTALVTVVQKTGDAKARVEDPSGLLGRHDESSYDFTVGKSAKLIVESNCPNGTEQTECHCKTDCVTCTNTESCIWKSSFCRKKRFLESGDTCPCKRCKSWYDKEMKNTKWLKDLNENFKCPCYANFSFWYQVTPYDKSLSESWVTDPACSSSSINFCGTYHPGAYGCMRSKGASSFGAGQQCCYYKSTYIIPAGDPGAGTPDKGHSSLSSSHTTDDVDPFEWCCKECGLSDHCDYYIKHARKGDTSHCPYGPCERCKDWFNKEIIDTKWLRDLNTHFKCPCKVTFGFFYKVTPVDNPSNVSWITDPACTSSYCGKFHPGAAGCLRSLFASTYGAGQQCCYYPSGDIIPAGNPGAGTPDKGHSISISGSHSTDDVDPYEWCCTECKLPSHCDYYIKNVRKGDTSHCT